MFKISFYYLMLCCWVSTEVFAQDTLRVMTYNLLGYPSSSNVSAKNTNLAPIIAYLQPDILVVQEMETDVAGNPALLLNGALNIDGVTSYAAANFTYTATANIGNMLYYNSQKLALQAQYAIPFASVREMNHYRLYYLSPNLAQTHDTIFINVFAMHLKSSSSNADEITRQLMAATLMNYLDNTPSAQINTIVLGDSNIYNPSEEAYQTFTNYTSNPSISFTDPLGALGFSSWHDNSAFAPYFTQSTRNSSLSDGGATGGMDDRFDLILHDPAISSGAERVEIVANSYRAIGQDGLRHNQNLINPTNNSAPSNIINALYAMSDHLPVIVDVSVQYLAAITPNQAQSICMGDTTWLYAHTSAGSSYQWLHNDIPITGATDTVWAATQSGSYTVAVTQNGNTFISNPVLVNVLPQPQPIIMGMTTVCSQIAHTYSILPTSGHQYNWTISANGTITSGQNTPSITVIWSGGGVGTVSVVETAF